jgi:hypothetical protein
MKQQFFITHTIRRTQIPALLASRIINAPSVKTLCPQTNFFSLYFRKNLMCLTLVCLLRVCQVLLSVPCKTVYRWVTANCCFTSDLCYPHTTFTVRMRKSILSSVSHSLNHGDCINKYLVSHTVGLSWCA